jgi:hypothetical protein
MSLAERFADDISLEYSLIDRMRIRGHVLNPQTITMLRTCFQRVHHVDWIEPENLQRLTDDFVRFVEDYAKMLNGGDGNASDSAAWGFARLLRAGATDPLEEPPTDLRSATEANAAFLLAEVHWRLDQKELARRWYEKAAEWMDKNKTEDEKLRGYRDEAAKLLGTVGKPATAKEPGKKP